MDMEMEMVKEREHEASNNTIQTIYKVQVQDKDVVIIPSPDYKSQHIWFRNTTEEMR
jgi:hypothetical protein